MEDQDLTDPRHHFSAAQYVDAMEKAGLTETDMRLFRCLYRAPRKTMTATRIADDMGFASYSAANLFYGRLARRICDHLPGPTDVEPYAGYLVRFTKPEDEWHWTMRPEVAEALEWLGLVADDELMAPDTQSASIVWERYHAYRVFAEFFKTFLVNRQSYISPGGAEVDIPAALEDIRQRFVIGFDASDESFQDKLSVQFEGAERNTKLVFANVEYLWSMPVGNISPARKRAYLTFWFPDEEVIAGDGYFFSGKHTIANPGSYYLLNKYHEMVALFSMIEELLGGGSQSAAALLERMETLCYSKIYRENHMNEWTGSGRKCSIYPAFLHLSNPDKYLPIISENHKKRIDAVFEYALEDEQISCREERLSRMQENLFDSYSVGVDPDTKRRWFFYQHDIKKLWIDKKGKAQQRASSVVAELLEEEAAEELEGQKAVHLGMRLKRSGKLVKMAKKRDGYSCLACGFHYKKQIVQAHHFDPLGERTEPKKTTLDDLVTLCPTCHYMAHFLLRLHGGDKYKMRDELVSGLRGVAAKS